MTNPARAAGLMIRRDRKDDRRGIGALAAWLVAMSGVIALGVPAPSAAATPPAPVAPTLRYGLTLPTTFAEYHGGYTSYTSDTDGNIIFSTGTFPGYLLRGVPGGALTVVAGTGIPGYSGDGSSAIAAQVGTPDAIKVGSDGSIYFVDGQAVRRVALDGTISRIAGKPAGTPTPPDCSSQPSIAFEGPAVCLDFPYISDVSIGTDGSVLTFESLYGFPPIPGLPTSPFVRSINNGVATMVAQSSQDGSCSGIPGPASTASFGQLSDAAAGNDGTVYLATMCQSPTSGSAIEILAIDSTGAVSVVAGGGSTAMAEGVVATDAQFVTQPAISTDATGRVYATLLDYFSGTSQFWMVGLDGLLHLVASGSGTAFAEGSSATSVAFRTAEAEPSGSVLVSSADPYSTALGRIANGALTVLNPGTPWVEPNDGVNAAGQYLSGAVAMAFDRSGDLYYSSGTTPIVRTISPSGVMGTRAGNGQLGTHVDGPATQSPLGAISDLSVDTRGNLAIATSNGVVRVSSSGDLASVADGGVPLAADTVVLGEDGTIFSSTNGWCPAFNCLVSTVKKVSSTGVVSTVYTQPATPGVYSTITGGALSPTTGKLSGVTSYHNALWTLDPETGVATASPIPTGINHMAIDPSGTVFYESNGIHSLAPDGTSVLVGAPPPESTYGAAVSAMAIDPKGNIWVAVAGPFGTRLYSYGGLAAHLPPLPPSAPTGAGSGTQITVNWNAPPSGQPNVDSYEVQVSTNPAAAFSAPATGSCAGPMDGTTTSCTITDLTPGTSYYVKVRATNVDGSSNWSAPSPAIAVPSVSGIRFFAGRLLLADGSPATGGAVDLHKAGIPTPVAQGSIDSSGRFRVQIEPGVYSATVGYSSSQTEWATTSFAIDLTSNNFEEDLRLPQRTPLALSLTDADGNPVSNQPILYSGGYGNVAVWAGGPPVYVAQATTGCTTGVDGTCSAETWVGLGPSSLSTRLTGGLLAQFVVPPITNVDPPSVHLDLPRTRTFSGIYRDGTGNPIAGAYLQVKNTFPTGFLSGTTTNSDGFFSMTVVAGPSILQPPVFNVGSYDIFRDGFPIDFTAGNLVQDLTLPPVTQIRFTVTNADGIPASGYQVSGGSLDGRAPLWANGPLGKLTGTYTYCTTDTSGQCTVSSYVGAASSNWSVQANSVSLRTIEVAAVTSTDQIEVGVALPRPTESRMIGRIVDSDGSPVAGISVVMVSNSGSTPPSARATTDANGDFNGLFSLPPTAGYYWMTILDPSRGRSLAALLEVADPGAGDIVVPQLQMPAPAPLTFRVEDAAGNPLPGLSLEPRRDSFLGAGWSFTQRGNITTLPAGVLDISFFFSTWGCNTDLNGECTVSSFVESGGGMWDLSIPNGPSHVISPSTFGDQFIPIQTSAGRTYVVHVDGYAGPQVPSTTGYTLTAARSTSGSATGTIGSDIGGLTCGVTCTRRYLPGATATLTATPGTDSVFVGWTGGGCTGTGTCTVTMNADTSVTASFAPTTSPITVTKAGSGSGTVTSAPAGISCGSTCSAQFDNGSSATLTAAPDANSVFTGWSGGGCTGTAPCTVPVTAATTVTATFTLKTYALTITKAGTGSGTVTSTPAGINCGTNCTTTITHGNQVTLSATAVAGSVFTGWTGGGCTGTSTCTVTATGPTSVTATFNPAPATVLPIAPDKPAVTASNGFLTVSWTAPSVGTPFTDSIVQMATSPSGPYTTVTAGICATHPSTATSCTVTGLTFGTTYYFKVRAVNAVGTGPASVASTGVKAVALPGAVGGLTCTKVVTRTALGSARAAWTSASKNGATIIRYEYAVKRSGSSTWGQWTTNSAVRSVRLTGLTKAVSYDIRVRAVNAVGAGVSSSCSVTP